MATSADFVLTKRAFQNTDMHALGSISFSNTNHVIGLRDHGISTPADLANKRLGLTKGTSGEYLAGHFLMLNGLDVNNIGIVSIPPSELKESIVSGKVDAVSTWGKFAYTIRKQLGEKAVVFPHDNSEGYYFLLLAKDQWINDNEERLQRLMRALSMAAELTESSPEVARQIINTKFQHEEEYSKYVWKQHKIDLELPQSMFFSMEEKALWLIENKLVSL